MDETIESNLELLLSEEPGGFVHALTDETIGGQLGDHDGEPCGNVPFFYDMNTGRIQWCGSHTAVPPEIQRDYSVGRLRFRASGTIVEAQAEIAHIEARKVIEQSVEYYNETQES